MGSILECPKVLGTAVWTDLCSVVRIAAHSDDDQQIDQAAAEKEKQYSGNDPVNRSNQRLDLPGGDCATTQALRQSVLRSIVSQRLVIRGGSDRRGGDCLLRGSVYRTVGRCAATLAEVGVLTKR